jgi:hypothetical protein
MIKRMKMIKHGFLKFLPQIFEKNYLYTMNENDFKLLIGGKNKINGEMVLNGFKKTKKIK